MLQQILLLSEIAQLGTASAIKPAMIMRLQDLIEDYVMCGAALFQDTAMKPTHHYLLGYLFFDFAVRAPNKNVDHFCGPKCTTNCQN